jgi:hypothetical protein
VGRATAPPTDDHRVGRNRRFGWLGFAACWTVFVMV